MEYTTIRELVETALEKGRSIGKAVLEDQAVQMEQSEEALMAQMEKSLQVMEKAVERGMDPQLRSTSGLTGGDAWKMMEYGKSGGITGSFMTGAMARALAVIEGMFTAAGFGMVIAKRASVSGAQGGCQAECGSAAAMTAAAMVEMMNGSPKQAADACAIALKNQLGLVCDPVAGLVEIPCIKRNVAGIMVAFSSADMALAGIESRIPADEVIDAMKEVGDSLPCALKETAQGGLANTPTAKRMKESVFGTQNRD